MFGTLGGPELLLILILALIVFGPSKLPDIGKSLGKMMFEFRKASNEFKRTIEDEVEADKLRRLAEAPSATAAVAAPGAATGAVVTPQPAEHSVPAGEPAASPIGAPAPIEPK